MPYKGLKWAWQQSPPKFGLLGPQTDLLPGIMLEKDRAQTCMNIASFASGLMMVPLDMTSTKRNSYMSQNTVAITVPAQEAASIFLFGFKFAWCHSTDASFFSFEAVNPYFISVMMRARNIFLSGSNCA
jgi:hypothetical protein